MTTTPPIVFSRPLMQRLFAGMLALIWLSASGCGFTFRGNDAYDSNLKEVAIIGRYQYSDIGKELTRKAEQYGITVKDDAAWAINITNDQFSRIRLTGTQNADTDEFLLKRQVTFELTHRHFDTAADQADTGSETYGPITAVRQSTFQDNQNQVLSKSNEQNIILSELQNKLASQILQQTDRITMNPPDCSEAHTDEKTPEASDGKKAP